jgi:hypothetical protein
VWVCGQPEGFAQSRLACMATFLVKERESLGTIIRVSRVITRWEKIKMKMKKKTREKEGGSTRRENRKEIERWELITPTLRLSP